MKEDYINKAFEALGEKISNLETKVTLDKFTIEALRKENADLKAENDRLKELLTPKPASECKIALYGKRGAENE